MKNTNKDKIIKAYKAENREEVKKYLQKSSNRSYKENPYLKHLETVIEYGKPPGNFYIIQLKNFNEKRLLGTILFSTGDRTLFFPGFRKLEIAHPTTKVFHEINHITCEKTLVTGHLKFKNRKIKFPDFLTKKEEICYFWFGLAIDKPQVLFKTPKHKELIKFSKNIKNDVDRRLELINECSKVGYGFDMGEKIINQNQFLNFEFFLAHNYKYDIKDFLKIPLSSSNADFKNGKTYPSMMITIKNDNSRLSSIIRLSILPKNKKNMLNLKKSSLFFHYFKPFKDK